MNEENNMDDILARAQYKRMNPDAPDDIDESNSDEPMDTEEHQDAQNTEEDHQEEPSEDTSYESSGEHDVDDYGNEMPKKEPRTYTEEEVNEKINKAVRDRLARLERNQGIQADQSTEKKASDAAQDFEYDPNAQGNWQQQLEQFVKQTVTRMNQEQQQQTLRQQEEQAQKAFEQKLVHGMERFDDFRDVVGSQPITDAMTMATRGMEDPASFLYAASKRHSDELERISKISDPYAQVTAIGKLEERMRKTKQPSRAPRPLPKSNGDQSISHTDADDISIEEKIQRSQEKRMKYLR